jgi:hypothetical protein
MLVPAARQRPNLKYLAVCTYERKSGSFVAKVFMSLNTL